VGRGPRHTTGTSHDKAELKALQRLFLSQRQEGKEEAGQAL